MRYGLQPWRHAVMIIHMNSTTAPAPTVAACGHWTVGPCDCREPFNERTAKRAQAVKACEVEAGDEVFTFGTDTVWGHAPARGWFKVVESCRSWEAVPTWSVRFAPRHGNVFPVDSEVWVRR